MIPIDSKPPSSQTEEAGRLMQNSVGYGIFAVVKRLLIFGGLWLLLTKGALSSWVIACMTIPAATLLSLKLLPPPTNREKPAFSIGFSLPKLVTFIPFFLWQSLRGGWQTACLALHPKLPLEPGFIQYQTQLPDSAARHAFVHIISLMPGTLSAALFDDQLHVHVLTEVEQGEQSLRLCEQRVGELFGGGT